MAEAPRPGGGLDQEGVARFPRRLLHGHAPGISQRVHVQAAERYRQPHVPRRGLHEPGVLAGLFAAEAVVGVGHVQLEAQLAAQPIQEQEQGHRVRAAGDSRNDAAVGERRNQVGQGALNAW